jgi:transglutaminase-like putative cysteine protease
MDQTLTIDPSPVRLRERIDFFGNRVLYFSTESVHDSLEVLVGSEVVTRARSVQDIFSSITWQDAVTDVAQALKTGNRDSIAARLYVLESPFARQQSALLSYAEESFGMGLDLRDSLLDLNQRLYDEFTYVPEFTTTATPVHGVLAGG